MKKNQAWQKLIGVVTIFMLMVALTAWQKNKSVDSAKTIMDTIPKKVNPKDFDDVLKELEKSKAEIEKSMKEIDFSALEKELRKPIPPVPPVPPMDAEKIKADVEKAMKNRKEIEVAQINDAVEAIAKIDWEKVNKQIEEAKVQMQNVEAQMKSLRPQIEESIRKAQVDIEKAKKEIEAYKSFIDALEKDGLINKKGQYKIEHKNGQLIINDKTQSASIYNRYKDFLHEHPTFSIIKDENGLHLNKDE